MSSSLSLEKFIGLPEGFLHVENMDLASLQAKTNSSTAIPGFQDSVMHSRGFETLADAHL